MKILFISIAIFSYLAFFDIHDVQKNHFVKSNKPNIVIILADQWKAQATGYSNDPNQIGKTPNLDALTNTGLNFKNAIAPSPVFTPNRAALMTGKYPNYYWNDL